MSIRSVPPAKRGSGRMTKDSWAVGDEPAPLVDGEGLSHRLTLLLNRVVSVLIDASASQFRALGLSIPATRALISLYELGGEMTVGTLAETTSIDLSTTSHILRRLERQGLVSRKRDTLDNRVVYATLTKAGRVIAAQCRDASLRHEEVLLGDISADDAKLLKQLLVRIYDNARTGFGA